LLELKAWSSAEVYLVLRQHGVRGESVDKGLDCFVPSRVLDTSGLEICTLSQPPPPFCHWLAVCPAIKPDMERCLSQASGGGRFERVLLKVSRRAVSIPVFEVTSHSIGRSLHGAQPIRRGMALARRFGRPHSRTSSFLDAQPHESNFLAVFASASSRT